MPGIKKQSGFTLIEILIALTVFAITSSALISGLTRHVSQAALLRDKTIAHWVAENEINEIRISGSEVSQRGGSKGSSKGSSKGPGNLDEARNFPGIGTNRKEVTMGDLEWQVRISVAATENKDIRRVTVDVYYTDDDDNSVVTLDAFVGKF